MSSSIVAMQNSVHPSLEQGGDLRHAALGRDRHTVFSLHAFPACSGQIHLNPGQRTVLRTLSWTRSKVKLRAADSAEKVVNMAISYEW